MQRCLARIMHRQAVKVRGWELSAGAAMCHCFRAAGYWQRGAVPGTANWRAIPAILLPLSGFPSAVLGTVARDDPQADCGPPLRGPPRTAQPGCSSGRLEGASGRACCRPGAGSRLPAAHAPLAPGGGFSALALARQRLGRHAGQAGALHGRPEVRLCCQGPTIVRAGRTGAWKELLCGARCLLLSDSSITAPPLPLAGMVGWDVRGVPGRMLSPCVAPKPHAWAWRCSTGKWPALLQPGPPGGRRLPGRRCCGSVPAGCWPAGSTPRWPLHSEVGGFKVGKRERE